jgi:hypothetical protein
MGARGADQSDWHSLLFSYRALCSILFVTSDL